MLWTAGLGKAPATKGRGKRQVLAQTLTLLQEIIPRFSTTVAMATLTQQLPFFVKCTPVSCIQVLA